MFREVNKVIFDKVNVGGSFAREKLDYIQRLEKESPNSASMSQDKK